MPRGRPKKGRKQDADVAVVPQIAEKLETRQESVSRPRTRAWVKQEEERERLKEPAPPAESVAIPNSTRQEGPPKPKASKGRQARPVKKLPQDNSQEPTGVKSRGPGKKKTSTENARQKQSVAGKLKTREGLGVDDHCPPEEGQPSRLKDPSLVAWLSHVEPVSPEQVHRVPDLYSSPIPERQESRATMDTSSTSAETGDNDSTAKGTVQKSVRVSGETLRFREISKKSSPDGRLQHLKDILKTSLPKRSMKDIGDLRSIAEDFLEQIKNHPDESCYPYLDEFSYRFDEGKSKIMYPIVNRNYFESDAKRCLLSNEAILQRTIMIHIMNQYWLGEMFDWNCEGQWVQPDAIRIPSCTGDKITMPKPDLMIGFTYESVLGKGRNPPIPQELRKCISPDGVGDFERCFPFLFFEVKKAGADLQNAYIANLHSASQALYNIWKWMTGTTQEAKFFEKIRVFSLVINAQDLGVRVHRAEKDVDGNLSFQFDELRPVDRYTKDQACFLIQTILRNYAAKELLRMIQIAFMEVVAKETALVASNKRKPGLGRASSAKRSRSGMQNETQSTGNSFAMAQMGTD